MTWALFWRSAPSSRTARLSRSMWRPFSGSMTRHDQWPLPHTPEHIAATSNSNPAQPRPRGHEGLEILRARLTYQSRKRGILETDLLLATFARDHLGTMSRTELEEYDKVGASSLSRPSTSR